MPSMLTDGSGANAALASTIGADVLARTRSLAALADQVRDVVMSRIVKEALLDLIEA